MIGELEDCRMKFIEADRVLDATVRPIRERLGYADELLQQAYERMVTEAQGNKRPEEEGH